MHFIKYLVVQLFKNKLNDPSDNIRLGNEPSIVEVHSGNRFNF